MPLTQGILHGETGTVSKVVALEKVSGNSRFDKGLDPTRRHTSYLPTRQRVQSITHI